MLSYIKEVRALFSDKEAWTQDHLAEDAEGYPTDPKAGTAHCFCLLGGFYHVHPEPQANQFEFAEALGFQRKGCWPATSYLTEFNDSSSYDAVMAYVDTRISELEARELSEARFAA